MKKKQRLLRGILCLLTAILLPCWAVAQVESAPCNVPGVTYQTKEKQAKKVPNSRIPFRLASPYKMVQSDVSTPTLYGSLIYKLGWEYMANSEKPFGIYSFPAQADTEISEVSLNHLDALTGTLMEDRYLVITRTMNESTGGINNIILHNIDVKTWSVLSEVHLDPYWEALPLIITYDKIDSKIYALGYSEDWSHHVLATMNPETGELTTVATLGRVGEMSNVYAMSATANGGLYAICEDGNLYSIDKVTGTMTVVGNTGYSPQSLQSAVYDYDTNTLYWAASFNTGESKLCTVDLATGVATILSDFSEYEEFVGLFIIPEEQNDIPARVEAEFNFSNLGALSGNLAFTVPSYTVGGDNIEGNVDLVIKIDDEEYKSLSAAAGSNHNIEIEFTEGAHIISITAATANGVSETTYINVYAGVDIPKSVSNLTFEISDTGLATLSWDKVTEGAHGGYIDVARLLYRVTRADGSVAAESLVDNVFTEQLSDIIAIHSYTVTSYVDDKSGVSVTSNEIKYGKYVEIPYYNDFENRTDVMTDFNIINGNSDYFYWECQNNWDETGYVLIYYCSWSDPADDCIMTPPFFFDNTKLYRLTFDHSINDEWSSYINKLMILGSKDAEGNDLSVEIANFEDISNGSGSVEVIFAMPETDIYHLGFYIYSDPGQGAFWINNMSLECLGSASIPSKIDFDLNIIAVGDVENVEVKFTTPTLTAASQPLESLTAVNIYRNNESTPCYTLNSPEQGKEFVWVDENPGNGLVYYSVVAVNDYGESQKVEKSIFVGGYTTPYTETFEQKSNFDLFTIINNNNDDKTWRFSNGVARYEYSVSYAADDWMISPKVKLSPERMYKISFTGKSTPWNKENFRMTVGPDCDPDKHIVLVDLPDWMTGENETHYAYYSPQSENYYHVGLYAYSAKSRNTIEIDEISVIDAFSVKAPSSVYNLDISADAQGLLKATFTFNAPTTDAKGNALESLTKVDIFKGDDVNPIHSFDTPKPGEELTWIDENALQGVNTYRIVAANNEGYGVDVQESVFVGYDIPDVVTDLRIKGNATNSAGTLSWEAPLRGINGGHINTASLTYTIYREENWSFNEIATGITELTYHDEFNYTGEQQAYRYAVKAVSDEGTSGEVQQTIVYGTPYMIPFNESFANYSFTYNPWTSVQFDGSNCSWSNTSYDYTIELEEYDGDDGMLNFYKWSEDNEFAQGEMHSPKICLHNAIEPYLTFYMYHYDAGNTKNHLQVYISVDDNERVALGDAIKITSDVAGWKKYTISLKEYVDSNFFTIIFYAELHDGSSRVFIDKLSVDDILDYNLSIKDFTGSELIDINGGKYTVEVNNKGLNASGAYDVVLYCNDAEVDRQSGNELAVDSVDVYEFVIEYPGVVEAGKVRKYHAAVDYAADMKVSDNTSAAIEALIYTPPYPVINDLRGQGTSNNVSLSWSEPSLIYFTPENDGFEDYELFAIDNIGTWTLVDVDKQRTIGPRYGVTFTNCFEPKAWQVLDPQRINMYGPDVAPHTGSRCLFSMQSDGNLLDGTMVEPCNDDWLISEEIVGGTELTFWAMQPTSNYGGNEKFEVLYSTTDTDVASFILIEDVELDNMATWNEYSYTLPEDAKYFAIRHTLSFFGLWLDDITYYPTRTYLNLSVSNYNIYRDGVKVGESLTNNYTDNDVEPGDHLYAVSSVFDIGESAISNEITVNVVSAVEDCNTNAVNVYGKQQNIVVEHANNESVAVYSVDGKAWYIGKANGTTMIPVEQGVYIVKVGSLVEKVTVK